MIPIKRIPGKVISKLAYYYRRLTSPWRRLPDFIIIGAQKSGTSSLYYYLSQHPRLKMSVEKEIHYYNYYLQHGKGLGWYKSFFPLRLRSHGKKTGEASPNYLYSEKAPAELKKDLADVKLLVLLRNPIERAYSEYNMHVRQLKRKDFPASFEEALSNDNLSLEGSRLYLIRGLYAERIKNWLKYFNRDQFLFIKSEDFFKDPKKTLNDVYEFLEIEKTYPTNLKPQQVGSYSELSTETRAGLDNYFEKSNQELVELLGDRFRW